MSLWVDKRTEITGPGVHALIIGVSDYEFLPAPNQFPQAGRVTFGLTKVNIPATGAFRVARWLRDKYWHPNAKVKTIRLLLSPSEEELAQKDLPELKAEARQQPRAKRAEVWQAVQDWKQDCAGHPEDIAVLYVAGHGIQWGSKDDAIVLLEDFPKDERFLDWAIDIGKTLKGMSGDTMPQIQFYFVDACRIQPDEYSKFESAGDPVYPISKRGGDDLRAAPIYFAACPQTAAKGHRGRGTYFSEALVDCLDLYARQGPIKNSSLLAAQTHWHVSVSSLSDTLQDRIKEVARPDREKQDVVMGGLVRPAVFCASPAPPNVTVVVSVDPEDAAKLAFAELRDWSQSTVIKQSAPCVPRPLVLAEVPVGIYVLKVSVSGPNKNQYLFSVHAQPPEWNEPVKLS